MICAKCKQEIRQGEPTVSIRWNEGDKETEHRDCTAAAVTRAETAEAEVAELKTRLELVGGRADDMVDWYESERDRAERAEGELKTAQAFYNLTVMQRDAGDRFLNDLMRVLHLEPTGENIPDRSSAMRAVATLRARVAELEAGEEWQRIESFTDDGAVEWFVWQPGQKQAVRGYYWYGLWWDDWPGLDTTRPLSPAPTHYHPIIYPAPPQE